MNPRKLMIALLAALTLALALASQSHAAEFSLASETWVGVTDNNNIVSFKGIPFAAPPVAENRWQPPQPYQPGPTTHTANRFAAACMQGPHIENWYRDLVESLGEDPAVIKSPESGYSEDCLYLNIWSKSLAVNIPVMVWIHGGSNKGGWSYEPNYHGQMLAHKNVVVVSVAYRLGIFGNFSHRELIAEQSGTAGNYGLLDLVAALEWIQANIKSFGGNPKNVTILGESAGAANVAYLMASGKARGLFHKAIHQSAGYQQHQTGTLQQLTQNGEMLARQMDVNDLKALRSLSEVELLKGVEEFMPGLSFDSVARGHGLSATPGEIFQSGLQAKVPLMIGTNAHEWLMYIGDSTLDKYLKDYSVSDSKTGIDHHLGSLPLANQLDRIATAYEMLCPSLEMAGYVAGEQPAYVYQFTRVRQGPHWQSVGAYHGAEIPYVFNTHDDWLTTTDTDHLLTNMVQQYWVNFAITGNPHGDGLPPWSQYNNKARNVMELNIPAGMQPAPDQTLCRLMGY
ncbi:MAG TPA: carboxylesterase [Gammaproteobacteria bacterium]|nr:carboxylesterase [Gammaproteobacteria bacterium]